MAKKRGRPTTLTPKAADNLFKLVSTGKTFREACRALRLNYQTVIDRKSTDDQFYRRSARATLMGVEANMDMCEERLKRSTNKRISVDRELAHHYRWKASKLLSAYRPELNVKHGIVEQDDYDPGSPKNMFDWARRVAYLLTYGAEETRRRNTLALPEKVVNDE